ncbi:hypothetical protein U1Q18_004012 [Sarracenia purpurea var. burkii]
MAEFVRGDQRGTPPLLGIPLRTLLELGLPSPLVLRSLVLRSVSNSTASMAIHLFRCRDTQKILYMYVQFLTVGNRNWSPKNNF